MKNHLSTFAVAIVAMAAIGQPAQAQQNLKIGALRCDIAAGLGLIVTSAKPMQCVFVPTRGPSERYYGTIRKFGIDIGATNRGVLAWDVFAPTAGPITGALAGEYVGADASLTLGAGVGANALVGGFGRSFTLQPLSVDVQSGLALAAGVASMTLSSGNLKRSPAGRLTLARERNRTTDLTRRRARAVGRTSRPTP